MVSKDTASKIDIGIEAAMQAIPYIGAPLATIYFGNKQERRLRRIESFYDELKDEIELIQYEFANLQSHDPDSLSSIFETLHDKIENEHLEIKRQMYKRFFINNMITPINKENYEYRKLFLDILKQLTPTQIDILVFLRKQNQPLIDKSIGAPGVSKALIQGSIAFLKILGLVDSRLHGIVFSTEGSINETITISELGRDFHIFCMS